MLIKVNGVGRLAREPEQRFTQDGKSIVNFSIVSSEKFKDKENVCFINCTVFGGLGEKVVMPYLHKGSQIYVSGKLLLDQWTAKDGTKRSKHSVTVESLQMLGSKDEAQGGGYNNAPAGDTYSQPAPQVAPQQAQTSNIPEIDINEDGIPL